MVYDPEYEFDDEMPVVRSAASGGYYTVNKKEYFFPAALYKEVLAQDDATPLTRAGDRAFAKWINQFIADNKKNGVYQTTQPQRTGYQWSGGSKGMSEYWALPYSYGGKKGVEESTARLATVLRAMRTVLSVVDPEHKLTASYTKGTTSGWSGNKVALPIQPVKEITDLEEAINVESGFSIHEAWHSVYTRPIAESNAYAFDTLMKNSWNKYIFNVAEDVREEALGMADTPGFRSYINYVQEWLWNDDNVPKVYPDGTDEKSLEARSTAFFMFLREPDRADEQLTDPSFDGPRQWFANWIERYNNEVNAAPRMDIVDPLIQEARNYLGIPADAGNPSKQIMVLTPCGYNHEDDGADDAEDGEVKEALEAEIEEVSGATWNKVMGTPKESRVTGWNSGNAIQTVVIKKPRVLHPDRFKPSTSNMVQKAKAALSLRKAAAVADTRLMKSGQLDEDELHRFFTNDLRIFKDATVETIPDAALYLLVDCSGSMGDATYENCSMHYAAALAQVFVEALSTHPNVKVKVLGHTGDLGDAANGGSFYRIWEQGDPLNRLALMYGEIPQGDNYDGYAISWAGEMLKKETVDQRLLIVLSDGQPNGDAGYGGEAAMDHVREVTDRLLRQGVDVVQVAVGTGIPKEDQAHMFKHFIELRDELGGDPFASVFRKLTRLLQKFV